jgi:hypothetical protein
VENLTQNKKTLAILIALLIFMTGFGYVAGLMSNKILTLREAQEQCYDWLKTECPCYFEQEPTLNYTLNIGFVEDSNDQTK